MCAFVRVLFLLPPIRLLPLLPPLPLIPALLAPLIMHISLVNTKTTIGEDIVILGKVGVTTVVMAEVVVVDNMVVEVAIKASSITLLGI